MVDNKENKKPMNAVGTVSTRVRSKVVRYESIVATPKKRVVKKKTPEPTSPIAPLTSVRGQAPAQLDPEVVNKGKKPVRHASVTQKLVDADRKKIERAVVQEREYCEDTQTPISRKNLHVANLKAEKTTAYFKKDALDLCIFCNRKEFEGRTRGTKEIQQEVLIQCHTHAMEFGNDVACPSKFHPSCIKLYNADNFNAEYSASKQCQDALVCPLHSCSMCSVDMRKQTSFAGEMINCAICYRGYHKTCCLPAGCVERTVDVTLGEHRATTKMIICPHHLEEKGEKELPPPVKHVDICYICSRDCSVKPSISCAKCPRTMHKDCRKMKKVNGAKADETLCEWCVCKNGFVFNVGVLYISGRKWTYGVTRQWTALPDNYTPKLKNIGKLGYVLIEETPNKFVVKPVSNVAPFIDEYLQQRISGTVHESWDKQFVEDEVAKTNEYPDSRKVLHTRISTSIEICKQLSSVVQEKEPCGCKNQCRTNTCAYRKEGLECPSKCEEHKECQNRKVANQFVNEKVEVFCMDDMGYSVYAVADLAKGEFLMEYAGEVISSKEREKREKLAQRDNEAGHYMMNFVDGNMCVDAGARGNNARYINHSCIPNCTIKELKVFYKQTPKEEVQNDEILPEETKPRLAVFTTKEIKAGEQLFLNYKMKALNGRVISCRCGTPNCGGTLAGPTRKRKMSEEEKEKEPVSKKSKV